MFVFVLFCFGCEGNLNMDCKNLRENDNGLVLYRYRVFTGTCNTYYPNGEVKNIFTWEKGALQGLQTEFHKNGKLKTQYEVIGGSIQGKYVTFYESGAKEIEGVYQKGLQYGDWKRFDEVGKIIEIQHWNDGELIDSESFVEQQI